MQTAFTASLRSFPGLILLSHSSDLVLTFERASKTLTRVKWFSCHQLPYCLMTVHWVSLGKRRIMEVLCFSHAKKSHPPSAVFWAATGTLHLSHFWVVLQRGLVLYSSTCGSLGIKWQQISHLGCPDIRAHLNPQIFTCVQAGKAHQEIEKTYMHIRSWPYIFFCCKWKPLWPRCAQCLLRLGLLFFFPKSLCHPSVLKSSTAWVGARYTPGRQQRNSFVPKVVFTAALLCDGSQCITLLSQILHAWNEASNVYLPTVRVDRTNHYYSMGIGNQEEIPLK